MNELSVPRRQLSWQVLTHSLCRRLKEQSTQHRPVSPSHRLGHFTFAQILELGSSLREFLKVRPFSDVERYVETVP